jgi:hypothetical protein
MVEVFFFPLGKFFCHKSKIKNENFENEVIFWGVSIAKKSEKKIVKILTKFLYLVLIRSPKHKKGWF